MAISVFPRVDVTGTNRWSPLRKGHWSTDGLVLCLPCGQGHTGALYPETRIADTTTNVGGSPLGINFAAAAALLTVMQSGPATTLLPTSRATVLCVRQCADTTLRDGALFGAATGNTTNRLGAHVPYSDGNIYWDFGSTAGAGRLSVAFTKTTQIEAWAFIAGASGGSIWRNGIRLATQSTAVTRTNSAGAFCVNGRNGAVVDGDIQQIFFFALLDAEWTPTQVLEWTVNPWLMFGTESWRTVLGVAGLALDTVVGSYAVTGSAADLLTGGSPSGQTYAWAYVG